MGEDTLFAVAKGWWRSFEECLAAHFQGLDGGI